ncbi:MAG: NAD(+) diphosphatase, partial [Acidobacteriota bacterium]
VESVIPTARMHLPPTFVPLWSPPGRDEPSGLWLVFRGGKLLVLAGEERPAVPVGAVPPVAVDAPRCIGTLDGVPCWAGEALAGDLPAGAALEPLRRLFDRLPDAELAVAGRAAQVLEFERTHRFCGACAVETEPEDGGRARRCPRCEEVFYPRIAPAMMVLVTREGPAGRELLLARSPRFPRPIYSALAGFVEPSESLEDCVHREVREEVGLRVTDLRYFGSQCWPFPHSLMVAFLAEWAGGEIEPDPSEIAEARWFPVGALPPLPHRLSVARKLIDFAVAEAVRRSL